MKTFLLTSLTLLVLIFPLQAQEELVRTVYDTKTNTWVEVTCLVSKLPAYGYVPIRVVMNNGTKADHKLNLSFTSSDDSWTGGIMHSDGNSKMTSSFSFTCSRGSLETVEFLVPVVTVLKSGGYSTSTGLNMTLNCVGFGTTSGSMSTELDDDWPSVLISSALYVPNASTLNAHISSSRSSSDLEFAGKFNPKTMSTDWRAYSGQDVIVMNRGDWTDLDPGARTAMLEWNRLGGRLIIFTPNASDDLATLQIDPNQTGKKSTPRSFGTVNIINRPESQPLDPSVMETLVKPASPRYSTPHASLIEDYAKAWPLQTLLGEKNFNTALFVLILLAFGVLVGPINLFVFAKSGKRHKLFITTPLISLGASALLVLMIMLQDGFGGRGHRVLIMEIQPDENKAYIYQEQAARTGVLLGSSFETSEPTIITPVAIAPSRWARVTANSRTPSSYTAKHGKNGLDVSGDWFQSRSIHGHLLTTVRPTRARIELSQKAGPPTLNSTFDHNLETIFYHAHDGSWWQADALNKGNSVTLKPSNQGEFNAWLKRQKDKFSRKNSSHLDHLAKQPGRFFSTTDQATATDTYVAIKWLSTTTIVTGTISK